MKILADRIIWDSEDFLMGLVPNFASGVTRILGKGGASFQQNFDPYHAIPGVAYPGRTGTDVTNVSSVDELLIAAAQSTSGAYTYLLGTTKLHQLDLTSGDGSITPSGGTFPHTITPHGHSSLTAALGGVALYKVGTAQKLFYSWNDGTDWDVGIYDLSTTFDDDFMSTVPTSPLADNYGGDSAADYLALGQGKPHPLYVSEVNKLLYIGSGRYTHTFDGGAGANGTFYGATLIHELGFEVIGYGETGYDLVVFVCNNARTGRRGVAKALFYGADRQADPYNSITIDDDEISAPFNYLGTVGCFTRQRSDGRCALRLLENGRFRAKFYWSGTLPVNGGVDIKDDMIVWNSGGKIYAWGSRDGVYPVSGHQISSGLGSSSGILRAFDAGRLWASTGTTTSGGLQKFNSSSYASGRFVSLTAFPDFGFGFRGQLRRVRTVFARSASGGRSIDVNLVSNHNSATTTIIGSVTSISASQLIKEAVNDSSGNPFPSFDSLRLELDWGTGSGSTDAPGIVRVEALFDKININQ